MTDRNIWGEADKLEHVEQFGKNRVKLGSKWTRIGNIGSSSLVGNVITLADPATIVNFSENQKIAFGNPSCDRPRAGYLVVTKVDCLRNKVTANHNLNIIFTVCKDDDIYELFTEFDCLVDAIDAINDRLSELETEQRRLRALWE